MKDLKILFVNYSEIGGAGRACTTITNLLNTDEYVSIDFEGVIKTSLKTNPFQDIRTSIYSTIDNYFLKNANFKGMFSYLRDNNNKKLNKSIKNFNGIIHLHWVNGVISMNEIKKYLIQGKKIVWTIHDLYSITGGCHTNEGCLKYINAQCANCPAVKSIFNILPKKELKKKSEFWIDNKKIRIVFPSESLQNFYLNANYFNNVNNVVIRNPLRPIFYREHKKSNDLSSRNVVVGFISEDLDNPQKNLKFLIRILHQICVKNRINIDLNLIGKSNQNIKSTSHLNVKYLATINEETALVTEIERLDLLAVPSKFESFGYTVAEAAALGVPSVIFKGNGASELLEDKTSILMSEDNIDFYRKLEMLILHKDLRNKLGINAKIHINEKLNPNHIATKYKEVYMTLD